MQDPIEISVVVPAYQEENRIGLTVEQLSLYLEQYYPQSELIVVLDGCTDGTAEAARKNFKGSACRLRVIDLPVNRGKGNAVKEGMLAASGTYSFFTDADLSFAPELIGKFLQYLKNNADIAISQREKSVTYSQGGRRFLAVVSRAIIGNVVLPGIRDTQAGFKGFKSSAAKILFGELKTPGYLFDLDVLLRARRKGFRIEKVYVEWIDRPGSKVRVWKDAFNAAGDLLRISVREILARVGIGG
jgi:dolichyl-phosphate beta-glucosyltransferase